jgi:hypothetical protein
MNFRRNLRAVPGYLFWTIGVLALTSTSGGRISSKSASPTVNESAVAGTVRWIARYDGPGHDFDLTESIVLSPDNTRVYVTGYSPGIGPYNNDYATIAYDAATGATIWTARYDSPAHWMDNGKYLTISPDGTRLFVTGDSNADGSDSNYDFLTIAYNAATGEQLWVARYDFNSGQEEVSAIAVSPDGTRVYITGASQVAETNWDYATVAYDAATGAQVWVARHDGTAMDFDVATALVVSPDGSRIFVTGGSDSGIPGVLFFGQDFVTLAYEATTGVQLWIATYSPSLNGFDTAQAIALSPDGTRVFVAGQSDGTDINMSPDYAVVAYDASDGVQQWAARYDGAAQQGEQVTALAVSHDGARVFVTGASQGQTTDNDYATVAFDAATGSQLWVATYDGPGHGFDAAEALVVSPDNTRVYVTGASDGGTVGGSVSRPAPDSYANNLDYATIAYDAATGEQKWIARYDANHANDFGTAAALSEDGGTLYVTGGSTGTSIDLDYVTIAYRTGTVLDLLSVASRKVHGGSTTFDLSLNAGTPATIEPRIGGISSGDHTLVFSFFNTLSGVSGVSATATTSSGTEPITVLNTSGIGTDTHQYIVNLSGVPNASHLNVTLNSVTDSANNVGDVSAHMDVLLGDVNSSGRTDSGDVTAVRNRTVSVPDQQTFWFDVNTSGRIDSGDVTVTRNASVTVLPP